MRSKKIDTFFYSDSDNLIYSDLNKIYKKIGSPDFALAVPQEQPPFRWVATGAVSYWKLDILDEFCNFLIDYYTDPQKFAILRQKWDWHVQTQFLGGICDMSLMWHFVNQKEHMLLTEIQSDKTAFQININEQTNHFYSKNEYEVDQNDVKKIFFLDGMPYCKNILTGENIMFHNLQFQGGAKSLIKDFLRRAKC